MNMHAKLQRPAVLLMMSLALILALGTMGPGLCLAEEGVAGKTAESTEETLEPLIGPRTELILRAMSDYMKSVEQFSYRGKISFDDTLPTGQKLQYSADSKVAVKRPNQVYAERLGDTGNKRFWYDGKRATVVDGNLGVYATVEDVPGELGALMDHLMEKYDFAPPLGDLLYPDFYEAVIEEVQFGFYVGLHDVEGLRSHHLAFVTKYIDWQIWIEDGLQMVPRKILITYKALPGSPQYQVILTDWDLDARLPDVLFKVEMAALANLDKIAFLTEVDLEEMTKEKEAGHDK